MGGLCRQRVLNFCLVVDAVVADLSSGRNVLNVLLRKECIHHSWVCWHIPTIPRPEAGPQVSGQSVLHNDF